MSVSRNDTGGWNGEMGPGSFGVCGILHMKDGITDGWMDGWLMNDETLFVFLFVFLFGVWFSCACLLVYVTRLLCMYVL